MRQLESYADERLTAACIYCGRATQTRDHVPSRVLLNEPYPNNLPVVPACNECNRGYSLDEEYFACLVECARTGSVQAAQRRKIIRILSECPALAEKLSRARSIHENGSISFFAEQQRIKNVALKLTRGHAYFEASETMHHEPSHFLATPLATLDEFARNHFETVPTSSIWPEVGSRAMQRRKRHFLAALFWVCFGFKLGMWPSCGHGGLGWMKGWRQLKALPGVGGTGLRRRSGGSWS